MSIYNDKTTRGKFTKLQAEKNKWGSGLFFDKISKKEKLGKKMKYLTTISNAADTGVNTTPIITGSLSIPAFASG